MFMINNREIVNLPVQARFIALEVNSHEIWKDQKFSRDKQNSRIIIYSMPVKNILFKVVMMQSSMWRNCLTNT